MQVLKFVQKRCHKFVSILQYGDCLLIFLISRFKNIAKIIICTLVSLLPWISQVNITICEMVGDYVIVSTLNHGTARKDTDSVIKGKHSYSINEHRPLFWSHPGIPVIITMKWYFFYL